jgi:hypothetical protein
VTLDANKSEVKKGKRVTLSGQLTEFLRQGECQNAQTVEIHRRKPGKGGFTPVEQAQTDTAGAFSVMERVRRTSQYRAQVEESATCGGDASTTERVKVKKPK